MTTDDEDKAKKMLDSLAAVVNPSMRDIPKERMSVLLDRFAEDAKMLDGEGAITLFVREVREATEAEDDQRCVLAVVELLRAMRRMGEVGDPEAFLWGVAMGEKKADEILVMTTRTT